MGYDHGAERFLTMNIVSGYEYVRTDLAASALIASPLHVIRIPLVDTSRRPHTMAGELSTASCRR
jgi:hypothetical protein